MEEKNWSQKEEYTIFDKQVDLEEKKQKRMKEKKEM